MLAGRGEAGAYRLEAFSADDFARALGLSLGRARVARRHAFQPRTELLYYDMGDRQGAREEAVSAAAACGRAGSTKESWVRELMNEIDNA